MFKKIILLALIPNLFIVINANADNGNEEIYQVSDSYISSIRPETSSGLPTQTTSKSKALPVIPASPIAQPEQSKRAALTYKVKQEIKPVIPNNSIVTTISPLQQSNTKLFSNQKTQVIEKTVPQKIEITAKPKLALPPPKVWRAETGTTLHGTLIKWSNEGKCSGIEKWRIEWNSTKDYSIDSALTFQGSYLEVIVNLFSLYKKAEYPLYADVYKSQCLIIVNDLSKNKK
ncbi:toxin co-regulated pilus biosynthesis Q family protein [Xenorhabdus bovienii]|uniref:toxin co-regulated pilus biosynthesis Q family protein n=1 Tax=Xenorhabdus bovienii TaxID=40576 RepID=UPI003DA31AC2